MRGKKERINVAPRVLVIFLLLLVSDQSGLVTVTLLAAVLHEAGHLLAAHLLHVPLRRMRIDLVGARLEIGGRMISYREEWLLAVAGPATSFFVAALGSLLWQFGERALYFSAASFLLGALNLLPIRSFDGGRMLEALVCSFAGERLADRVMTLTSFSFLFLLWATAVYFLLRAGDGISLLFFSVSLFLRFFEYERL